MGEQNWFVIIPTFLGCALLIVLSLWWLVHDRTKRAAEWDRLTHPDNAREMTHHGHTPDRGEVIVVVGPYKWAMIRWDKSKNQLKIYTRPETYREEDPVERVLINWMVKREKPRQKVRIEDYMKRQVM